MVRYMLDLDAMGPPAIWATVVALGARNGMEDLHAAGAIPDSAMPTVNRALRTRLFDAFRCIMEMSDEHPNSEAIEEWCWERLEPDVADPFAAAIPGAVLDALTDAADAHRLDEDSIDRLADAGAVEADKYYGIMVGGEEKARELTWLIASVPSYLEPPTHSPEVEALLAAGSGRTGLASDSEREHELP